MREPAGGVPIIQILAPDDAAWESQRAPESTTQHPARAPTPSSRHARKGHALLALAVVAVTAGTVLALDEDDHATAPPSATTNVTGTSASTRLAPDGSGEAAGVAGRFVIDVPGLRPYSADVVTAPTVDDGFVLWSSGNATRPWVSAQLGRNHGDPPAFLNATRRVVDGRELLSPRDQLSTTEMVVPIGERLTVRIRAFDVEDRALIAFADTLRLRAGVLTGDLGAFAGLQLTPTATTRSAAELLYGRVTTEMRSLTSDGRLVTLRVAEPTAPDETDVAGDPRTATLPFFTTGLVEGDADYVAGTLTASGDGVVLWTAGGYRLSLTGPLPAQDLLAISASVRPARGTEWDGLLYGLRPDYRLGEYATIATGTDGSGADWFAGVQQARRGGKDRYLWWWTVPGAPDVSASASTSADLAATPTAETVVVGGATYVFVSAPGVGAAGEAATTAMVSDASGTVVEVTLQSPFAGAGLRVGATRVDVPGRIEVTIDGSPSMAF